MGVIHSGIELSSVVFDREGKAYITDFGMASRQDDQAKRVILGAPEFLVPSSGRASNLLPKLINIPSLCLRTCLSLAVVPLKDNRIRRSERRTLFGVQFLHMKKQCE